ncbi:MAG: hypothetical protein IPN85_15005 [Flavobacteriales bacterium]|nr:hypothetical protein [Flavobacteriales bacterium]
MARLAAAGRADLAKEVEWVAKTQGDGLGYDIRSFSIDGAMEEACLTAPVSYRAWPR